MKKGQQSGKPAVREMTLSELVFYLFEVYLAVLVQSFMLAQCGLTYTLIRWRNKNKGYPSGLKPLKPHNGIVSVIIPAYNESANIERTLRRIATTIGSPERVEVIVVDAGGTDGTMEIVRRVASELIEEKSSLTVRTDVTASGGRGPTLRAGVDASKGGILLFLHADTMLPDCFDALVRRALEQESVLATAFRFKVSESPETPIAAIGWMEWTVHLRSVWFELPFGDQAMAMTRQRYEAVNGFPNVPMMEDFELVQALRRAGAAGAGFIKTLEAPAICDSRRWAKKGVWRCNLINQLIMIAYVYLGYSPRQIYQWYYRTSPATNAPKQVHSTPLHSDNNNAGPSPSKQNGHAKKLE